METIIERQIKEDWEKALRDFFQKTHLKEGTLIIIGCSTSEIKGEIIGSSSNQKIANILYTVLEEIAKGYKVDVAVQCCEHLNRALILERKIAEKLYYPEVNVVPSLDAGGAFAVAAFENMQDPIAVEAVQADAGLDIGDTFIGMHLKQVAVPLRLAIKKIGQAHLTAVRTRPKHIGGERAVYREDLK
ncbi:MAG TPA: TIGR01440 family protein [Candidatus Eisenbacteria bacterium]|nr:TIGR01440 family protein [Candidatus Eisenbacteria bacterium]